MHAYLLHLLSLMMSIMNIELLTAFSRCVDYVDYNVIKLLASCIAVQLGESPIPWALFIFTLSVQQLN